MKTKTSKWYRDFIMSHPEEERQDRWEWRGTSIPWTLKQFMELTNDQFIPEEELDRFIVIRKPNPEYRGTR